MPTKYTVSPLDDGSGKFGVFEDGEFYDSPGTGTWGACKKVANRLNGQLRTVHMKYAPQLAKDYKERPIGDQWIHERKWDGMRAIFEIQENETFIFSRTGQDLREQYPELGRLHEILPVCILDGEIVAMVDADTENLEKLQDRISQKNPSPQLIEQTNLSVKFFDILESEGVDLRPQQFEVRRMILLDTVGPEFTVEVLQPGAEIPAHWEGTVAKLASSRYESGKRRSSWQKYKFVNRATLQVVELTEGKGARRGSFGAVVVADKKGKVRGQVGSGFTQSDIDILMAWKESPYTLFIEVEYRFLSKTGLMVNTAFKGFRSDKTEADVL